MSKVKIISDSTCDLSEELLAQFDVAVLPHPIVRDGELLQDNVTITPDDIYDIMSRQADYVRHLRRIPMTMRCAGNPGWMKDMRLYTLQ